MPLVSKKSFYGSSKNTFEYLAQASVDLRTAFRFLAWANWAELAEKALLDGLEPVRSTITSLVSSEFDRTLNKIEEQ